MDTAQQTQPVTTATTQLITDIQADRELGVKLIAAYKSGGIKALVPLLPEVEQAVEKEIPIVKSAISEIKAGYKTTEFWLTTVVVFGNMVFFMVKGKTFPIDLNATVVAATAFYSAIRMMLKK